MTDKQVIEISNDYYLKHKQSIDIQNYEGFIRQVIGWRNYVYTKYKLEGETMYEMNFLKHENKINTKKWWEGQTGILPIDSIIHKIVKYSYAHHIERLMYLGNFMLLCQFHPKQIHKMFMEWTIDAYDWVMVPNVFGMSQYADGGKMMTRPYFSSSNYIHHMSNLKKTKDDKWWEIWDALYYNFIHTHQKLLSKNYATSRQVKHWNDKTENQKKVLLNIAKNYLEQL